MAVALLPQSRNLETTVKRARHWAQDRAAYLGGSHKAAENVGLLVDELVNNAYENTPGRNKGPALKLERKGDQLVLWLVDPELTKDVVQELRNSIKEAEEVRKSNGFPEVSAERGRGLFLCVTYSSFRVAQDPNRFEVSLPVNPPETEKS